MTVGWLGKLSDWSMRFDPHHHILRDDGVGADLRVRSDRDRSQYLGAGTDVDVPPNDWYTRTRTASDGDLLKYQAVHADFGVRVNHDPVGVRY